ncbi:hypothetical protein J3F83DRAFT_140981 [Trichoderma novae-zelandiae]
MSHAWLDSLTEDWVSERGSSPAPLSLVKSTKKSEPSPSPRITPSRIPRWRVPGVVAQSPQDKSMTILEGDRSSEDNKSPKKRLLKFAKDRKPPHKGYLGRSLSSTSGSVVVHKNARQRTPATPGRSETPEWKRRLVHGKLGYGEQRDLFSSAAVGLQDMFRPPPSSEADIDSPSPNFDSPSPNLDSPSPNYDLPSPMPDSSLPNLEALHLESSSAADSYEADLPSSPPAPKDPTNTLESERELDADEEDGGSSPNQVTPSPSPRRPLREFKYKLNVEDDQDAHSDASIMSGDSPVDPSAPSTGEVEHEAKKQGAQEAEDGEEEEETGQDGGSAARDDSSYLAIPSLIDGVSRKASGQSYTRNEDFSPILIGKHSDEDGKVEFTPLEMPAEELRQRLERLQLNQMILDPSHNASESAVDAKPSNAGAGDDSSIKYHFDTSYGSNGSPEGSLRHHSLSPDLGEDWSEMLGEDSLQASTPKQFPTLRTQDADSNVLDSFFDSPDVPRAPFPSPDKRQIRETSTQSNTSPLKLFGPYDTFTNQTLLRRISQFEESLSGMNSRGDLPSSTPSRDPSKKRVDRTPGAKRYLSHFGAGELEGYEFTNELSQSPAEHSSLLFKEKTTPLHPPLAAKGPLKLVPPSSWLHEDVSLHVRRSRSKSNSQTPSVDASAEYDSMSSSPANSTSSQDEAYDESWAAKRDYGSEGKRPRASPSKHPTPKRRRTLHRSDIAFGSENRKSIVPKLLRPGSKLRRRSQTERSNSIDLQDADRVSMRQSHSSAHASKSVQDDVSQGRARRSPTRSSIQEEDEPDSPGTTNTERKPSIRTQDFVDQAAQIMAMIRNQVSQPGLSSLEESELEVGVATQNATMEESDGSTAEPFSRPPSRDGKPIPRQSRQQEDPELVKRLKKYQEMSDMGDVISSSVRSMSLAKDAIRAAKEVERMVDRASRIRSSGSGGGGGGGGGSNYDSASESTSPVHDLFSSTSARSTSHLFPTSSSRGSESRKVIAPESVSHLIPDKIGGMYLDKQNNIWIRNKDSKSSLTSHNSGSDDSEEDPFANIPDLSVDMTEEMQHLKQTPRGREGAATNKGKTSRQSSAQTHSLKSYTTLAAYEPLDPEVAARARGEIEKLDAQPGEGSKSADDGGSRLPVLKAKTSSDGLSSKRRNITISFTSPIASIILGVLPEDIEGLEDDPVPGGSSESPPLHAAQFSGSKGVSQGSMRTVRATSMSSGKFTPRPVSRIDEQDEESTVELPNQNRHKAQNQQAHAQNDRHLSFVGDNTMMSLKSLEGGSGFGFLMSTPAHAAVSLRADDSLMIGRNVGKLSLSPLSEFSMNNHDKSFGLEVSYVMGQKRMATGDGSKKVMSMTLRYLVEKLSEAQPHEPYWEDMISLTLQDKQLTSLHGLNKLCSRITTLDVSRNSLGHLEGLPECVRQLKVSNNMLTELTSWDHLIHLQYLDISNNQVKSLSALKRLIHLRSLRADNNLLTSLDGLDSHDGLLTLRARHNMIEELDFSGIEWERLTELDVASNKISSVKGLHLLPALSHLDISDNHLETLVFDKANKTLRKLDISDNDVESLDIRHLGNLQTLHADRNRMSRISGFRHVRRMDSLSLREQRGDAPLDLDFLISACEIRKLFLSGNYLASLQLKADFLNLQLLELANCGLEVLPEECGQLMPNLRTLNVNFNAIRDLSSLRFIPRLKKLLAAGNRLSDTVAVTELLTDFPHLTELDLRDNPITQGFYPPAQMLISPDKMGGADSFVMPDADMERDETFAKRLDETTKLRRRLHEVVYVASCKRLRRFDGLAVVREKTLAKDVLLQRLIDDGLVPELEDTLVAESESAQQQQLQQQHNEAITSPSFSTM